MYMSGLTGESVVQVLTCPLGTPGASLCHGLTSGLWSGLHLDPPFISAPVLPRAVAWSPGHFLIERTCPLVCLTFAQW